MQMHKTEVNKVKVDRRKLELAMARAHMDTRDVVEKAEIPRPRFNYAIVGRSFGISGSERKNSPACPGRSRSGGNGRSGHGIVEMLWQKERRRGRGTGEDTDDDHDRPGG